jgi:membrane protein required for colicin V production
VSFFDLIVVGIVILSALLASVRGFTREVLAIGSWVAAGAAAYAFHPFVLSYVTPYIANKQIALAAAIAIVFLIVLVAVTLVTVRISDMILDSRIGTLDRSLGFLFGAARGLLIAAIAFIFFDKLVGEKQYPEWVKNAHVRPLLKETGDVILGFVPADPEMLERLKNRAKNGQEGGANSAPAPAENGATAPAANGTAAPKTP